MSGNTRLSWLRIGVEGVAIVVSILLAFFIEAGWSEKQARGEEQGALNGLRSDFLESRSLLASAIATLEGSQVRFARFQSSTPEELASIASDSAGRMVNAFVSGLTYDPVLTTLESAASDGRLGLIRDPDLRQWLATWVRALEDLEENELDIRSQALRVVRSSERLGGPFHNAALGEGRGGVLPRADGSTIAALRSDSAFVAHVRSHHYTIAFYLRELRPLAQVIDSTLVLIDANIR